MLLNVTDVLMSEGKTVKQQVQLEMNAVHYAGQDFQIASKDPVQLTFTNVGKGKAQVEGTAEVTVVMNCDRCLKDVGYDFKIHFFRSLFAPEAVTKELDLEDDANLVGFQLDVDDLVYNEISVNWPMKVLCRDDCRGICSKCGKDLNEGTCDCDTFVPDPRLAAIKDIFNAGKEV